MHIQGKIEYDRHVHLEEIMTMGILVVLNSLILLIPGLRNAPIVFTMNCIFMLILVIVPLLHFRYIQHRGFEAFRDFYALIIGVIVFFEHHHLVPLINPHDVDEVLIGLDRFLFLGNDPTVLAESISFPPLTELLQLGYATFYFLPAALIVILYLKGKKIQFHIVASTIFFGLYICYLGYYITPAIGPRFTLGHLQSTHLEGVFLFDSIRNTLDAWEGITRDCCPSGHTMHSVVTAMLAYMFYRPFFKVASVWAAIMVLSTVYLRYHYVVDVFAGLIFALVVVRFVPQLAHRFIFWRSPTRKSLAAGQGESGLLESLRNTE
ncbi:MAG: phosphatase PAP2 family protein [Spirochaetes bacterium]|nr:MAG: phosphatase PAP2 family protein [Spirochaetota bacterium]